MVLLFTAAVCAGLQAAEYTTEAASQEAMAAWSELQHGEMKDVIATVGLIASVDSLVTAWRINGSLKEELASINRMLSNYEESIEGLMRALQAQHQANPIRSMLTQVSVNAHLHKGFEESRRQLIEFLTQEIGKLPPAHHLLARPQPVVTQMRYGLFSRLLNDLKHAASMDDIRSIVQTLEGRLDRIDLFYSGSAGHLDKANKIFSAARRSGRYSAKLPELWYAREEAFDFMLKSFEGLDPYDQQLFHRMSNSSGALESLLARHRWETFWRRSPQPITPKIRQGLQNQADMYLETAKRLRGKADQARQESLAVAKASARATWLKRAGRLGIALEAWFFVAELNDSDEPDELRDLMHTYNAHAADTLLRRHPLLEGEITAFVQALKDAVVDNAYGGGAW